MWRSFFYAVGIGLFGLGLQTLVVDHFNVPKDTRLQNVIRKILSDENPNANGAGFGANAQPGLAIQTSGNPVPFQNNQNGFRPFQGRQTGSRFGPSRFEGPAYGDYGGARVSTVGTRQPFFSQGNFGNSPAGNTNTGVNAIQAGYPGSTVQQQSLQKPRTAIQRINVREWMPWSLLAAGAITFLYTHSIGRGRGE